MKFYANLKSNHTRESFSNYAEILDKELDGQSVVVFPPFSAFSGKKHKFKQGAQNFYPALKGSFTGEITKEMLDEFGIETLLIGHSERRTILGESDDFLRDKFEFAKKQGYDVVYCIGESDIVYMNGSTKSFLKSQLKNIDLGYDKLTIAYEPIWAIGSGKSATTEYIKEILDFLKTLSNAPLLYGGSVNLENIKAISQIKNCDGVLVGSASLNAKEFLNLIKECR
ncbi:triose-phosphate isomerase [uncultured Campylobacter sp.]|uniref:triose-phosphate isomerase n=1 Tax=uncultured Campylobacter sp. TaxID=218934 RepID=UPI00261F3A05|nr:triose-phosphate isomerase [uncultured Campylobacter sp.]